MNAIHDDTQLQRLFFINAPGAYGKTILIETLLCTVRGLGKIALAVASSGITAELLEGGQTAHSRFRIPIPLKENHQHAVYLSNLILLNSFSRHPSSYGMRL